eukprot:5681251-Ditylum_brightwellii.AAC.1
MQFEGLIIKPNVKEMLQVNCFADTDFTGLISIEDPQDVTLLQTEVALSTLHAEYVALSQSLRDLLPTKDLITE